MLDVLVQAKLPVRQAHVACVVPVGDVDIVFGQQRLHRATEQGREVARQRRYQENPRLRDLEVLPEAQQCPEWGDVGSLFAHPHVPVTDFDATDVERWPGVAQSGARHQFVGSSQTPDHDILRGPRQAAG